MPLTAKGKKMKAAFKKEYGDKKGESVFYAYENKHKDSGGVVKKSSSKAYKKKIAKKAKGSNYNKVRESFVKKVTGKY
jgi:hypothetical protein